MSVIDPKRTFDRTHIVSLGSLRRVFDSHLANSADSTGYKEYHQRSRPRRWGQDCDGLGGVAMFNRFGACVASLGICIRVVRFLGAPVRVSLNDQRSLRP